jgi:glycogen debranching enzyme
VLKHRSLYLLSDAFGDIHPDTRGLGLYDGDTRILSCSSFRVGGQRPVILRSDPGGTWRGVIQATNPSLGRDPADIRPGTPQIDRDTISISRERTIADRYRERITITNHGTSPLTLALEIGFDADGADIFEVRGYARPGRGTLLPIEAPDAASLVYAYQGLDGVTLRTHLAFSEPAALSPGPPDGPATVVARWTWELASGAGRSLTWEARATRDPDPARAGDGPDDSAARATLASDPPAEAADPAAAARAWRAGCAEIDTDNDLVDLVLERSFDDLGLLISTGPDGERHLVAGVPWFAALFGRDALITALQALPFQPQLAIETLDVLARRQADELDDWHDAEPGKILHELRSGEMARTGELPFTPYYGSIDATPLWLILLGATHDWTGDDGLVERFWPNVEAALEWIAVWGDRDGDGFVEYLRRSQRGLDNQGWKDSGDSIRHADGSLAEPPIALAEVQGYVYDAKLRIAGLARRRGDAGLAEQLEREAADLRRRFAESFWLPDRGFLAMALDGRGRPAEALGSNAGHALWSGIVEPEHAGAVAAALTGPSMASGWGLRTYAAGQPGYNPIGYHTGSVWPHDTAIAAAGLKRYGFHAAANDLAIGVLEAAQHFPASRLPELFGGYDRAETIVPVAYPVACSPQAWAAGTPLMLLSTMIGLRARASEGILELDRPDLPPWIRQVTIRNLRVGGATCDLLVQRWRTLTSAEVLRKDGDLEVNVRL